MPREVKHFDISEETAQEINKTIEIIYQEGELIGHVKGLTGYTLPVLMRMSRQHPELYSYIEARIDAVEPVELFNYYVFGATLTYDAIDRELKKRKQGVKVSEDDIKRYFIDQFLSENPKLLNEAELLARFDKVISGMEKIKANPTWFFNKIKRYSHNLDELIRTFAYPFYRGSPAKATEYMSGVGDVGMIMLPKIDPIFRLRSRNVR